MGSVEIGSKIKYNENVLVDALIQQNSVFNLNTFQRDNRKFTRGSAYVIADFISRTELQSECSYVLSSNIYQSVKCKLIKENLRDPVRRNK